MIKEGYQNTYQGSHETTLSHKKKDLTSFRPSLGISHPHFMVDEFIDDLTLSIFGSTASYYFWAIICALPASIFFLVIIELGYTLFVNN